MHRGNEVSYDTCDIAIADVPCWRLGGWLPISRTRTPCLKNRGHCKRRARGSRDDREPLDSQP